MKFFRTKLLPGILVCSTLLIAQPQKPRTGKLAIASDLDQRLARWRSVKMPLDASYLTPSELRMIDKLVVACHYLEDIFWRQSDPEGLELYKSLEKSNGDPKLRRLLFINGSRFDLIDKNKPFVGAEPMPAGRGLYPQGVTRRQLEDYVKRHPEKKAEIYNPYTVVKRQGDGFTGVPYHIQYQKWLGPAAAALKDAARLSGDP
ncbi:MAG: hypothetical protein DMG57_35610, partial [Acidobacteria bacterium]